MAIEDTILKFKKDLSEIVASLFSASTGRVSDINKEAEKNTFRMYAVISSSVPDAVRGNISKQLEVKIGATISSIIQRTVESSDQDISSFFANKFRPLGSDPNTLNAMSTSHDVVFEKLAMLDEAKLQKSSKEDLDKKARETRQRAAGNFEKARQNEVKRDAELHQRGVNKINKHIANSEAKNGPIKTPEEFNGRRMFIDSTVKTNSNISTRSKDYVVSAGSVFSQTIYFKDKDGNFGNNSMELTFRVIVNLMVVPADKLITAIADTKDRSNYYNYVSARAGSSTFFKDFLLNLKQINKDAKRDTSKSLEDRVISSMLSAGGVTMPHLIADMIETKHYTLILDKGDLDTLEKSHNMTIFNNDNGIKMLFKNMKILTLVVVDQIRQELVYFDSNDHTKFNVISYKRIDSQEDLYKLYQSLSNR